MRTKGIIRALLVGLVVCGCKSAKQPELGEPLAGLTPEQQAQFREGKKVFERVFTPRDGLGPLFNANSCAECHEDPVLGGVGDEVEINGTPVPPDTDPAPDPEISLEDIEKVTAFIRFLAPPPPQRLTNHYDCLLARRGEELFVDLKCARCHIPKLKTGPSPIKPLDRKYVSLYSDLLVHDMGRELADICLEQAHPSEFRTEMLMGLRFRERFLHDGSAHSVEDAIKRHGGEAQGSSDRFEKLDDADKKALLKFLQTL